MVKLFSNNSDLSDVLHKCIRRLLWNFYQPNQQTLNIKFCSTFHWVENLRFHMTHIKVNFILSNRKRICTFFSYKRPVVRLAQVWSGAFLHSFSMWSKLIASRLLRSRIHERRVISHRILYHLNEKEHSTVRK